MVGDLQNIQEEGDYSCIYQIGEHRTNNWDDEERLYSIVIFITYSTHVGHGIGTWPYRGTMTG